MCVAAAIAGAAVVGAGASIYAGNKAAGATRDAAKVQQQSADASIAESQRQYDQTRADYAPFRQIGVDAIGKLNALYGLPGQTAKPLSFNEWSASNLPQSDQAQNPQNVSPDILNIINAQRAQYGNTPLESMPIPYTNGAQSSADLQSGYQNYLNDFNKSNVPRGTPDLSSFTLSPDYQFRKTEGLKDIGNSFAARGGAASGNALKAIADYNSNLASGEYGNYVNRLFGMANIGASGTSGTASAGAQNSQNVINIGQNNAANQGSALIGAANARASGVNGALNSLNQGIGNYMLYNKLYGGTNGLKYNNMTWVGG